MKVLFLAPDLFRAPGGIARYGRLVVKALTESRDITELDVLALHDKPGGQPDPRYWGPGCHSYSAFGSDRLRFSRAVALQLRRKRYDCVLSGHAYLTPLPYLLDLRGSSKRLVTFVYGLDATSRLPWYRRIPLRKSAEVIAITRFTADLTARANTIPQHKISILHNCLDPVFTSADDTHADSSPSAVAPFAKHAILTVSRLTAADTYKGHRVILRALPEVIRAVPDVIYYVVGEGELLYELKDEAARLGVSEHVVFLGTVSDADLARCYQMARVFAMPSKGEGFGFVFLEAMAYGCPVVAGSRDAAPEVVGHEEAGLIVDPDSVPQVVDAITRLLNDEPLRQRFGNGGRDRAARMFGYELFKERLETYMSKRHVAARD